DGLKAFQEKQKAKKKGKDGDKEDKKDKKDEKKSDKKEDKKDKKEDKKDKKKSKKAELAEALLKLAEEVQASDDDEEIVTTAEKDDLDAEMDELGLLPKSDADDKCGMCGMAMDKEHACTASAKDDLVREALAAR